MTKQSFLSILGYLVLATSALLVGCQQKPPYNLIGFSGTVTLDGKPLKIASLQLEPLEKQPAQAFTYIKDGKFLVPDKEGVTPGRYRVIISTEGLVGGSAGEATSEGDESSDATSASSKTMAQQVPRQYGGSSQLEMLIQSSGKNDFQYELKTSERVLKLP